MTTNPIECDIVNAADGTKMCSVRLSVMPRQGDGIDLDTEYSAGRLFRVVEVRYHVRPRKLAGVRWAFRTDDLMGVSVYVTLGLSTIPLA